MSRLADEIFRDWEMRTHRPRPAQLDPYYNYQLMLRVMLDQLAIILQDENIPQDKIARILRALTYGAPNPVDAELRMAMVTDLSELKIRMRHLGLDLPDGL